MMGSAYPGHAAFSSSSEMKASGGRSWRRRILSPRSAQATSQRPSSRAMAPLFRAASSSCPRSLRQLARLSGLTLALLAPQPMSQRGGLLRRNDFRLLCNDP